MTRRKKRYKSEPPRQFVTPGDALLVRTAVNENWDTPLENQKRIIEDIVEMATKGSPRRSLAAFKVILAVQKLEMKLLKSQTKIRTKIRCQDPKTRFVTLRRTRFSDRAVIRVYWRSFAVLSKASVTSTSSNDGVTPGI